VIRLRRCSGAHSEHCPTALGSDPGTRGEPVAVSESLTGGELSARLASTPGAGAWFRGGLVAYASEVKHEVLDVPASGIDTSFVGFRFRWFVGRCNYPARFGLTPFAFAFRGTRRPVLPSGVFAGRVTS
jgi:hypothetical protein